MQNHLNRRDTINLGSFYTPPKIVQIAYTMLENHINLKDFLIFDSSCGYGDFLRGDLRSLGADIDAQALKKVPQNIASLHTNSLENVSRKKFGIAANEPLIMIGNPPYNDKTSIIRNGVKTELFKVDSDLIFRDIGISFLRSYDKLGADFVCVLHPLSYLIKRANFGALNKFAKNYRLIDGIVISSQIFTPKSSTFFPIIIALYERNCDGMDYQFIQNYRFKTIENQSFCLNDFDFITNYITKYPNHADPRPAVAYFHTLRDINALKRNQTFMPHQTPNAIKVFSDNLKYYCYIHHFKQFAARLPYFFGNMDIFINNADFAKIESDFLELKHNARIEHYFCELFKEYV